VAFRATIKPQDAKSWVEGTTMDLEDGLHIKSSGLKIEINATGTGKEKPIIFGSYIDEFDIVFKMSNVDCSNIYSSLGMDRTYVENCLSFWTLNIGHVDFRLLTGSSDQSENNKVKYFIEAKLEGIIQGKLEKYYQTLIQSRKDMYYKEYATEQFKNMAESKEIECCPKEPQWCKIQGRSYECTESDGK